MAMRIMAAEPVENPPTRVLGVGVGVFVIGFFSVLCPLICCIGATTKSPGTFIFFSTLVYGLVLFILLAAQKEPRYTVEGPATLEIYDTTAIPRLVIFVMLAFASAVGLACLCSARDSKPTNARPVYERYPVPYRQPLF